MEAVIWVVAAIGAEAGSAALIMYAVEIGTAIYYTAIVLTTAAYMDRQKQKARDKYNSSQQDRLQNVVTTTGPRELVLGRVRKGGTLLFRDSCGPNKERFVMVIAIASHEIENIESFYLNEAKVTLDPNGWVLDEPYGILRKNSYYFPGHTTPPNAVADSIVYTVDENGDPVTYYQTAYADSKARIRYYKGTDTQTADARLMELFPDVWTVNHRLQGIAYVIAEFIFDETAFPSGLPNLTCVVNGAKVFDPRSSTTTYSVNPALHIRHVLTHPYIGKRETVSSAEDLRIIAAANACDMSYTPTGGTPTELYKSGIIVQYGAKAVDVIDDICAGMCGSWAYAGGEFFVKAGAYTAPVLSLNQSDLVTLQTDSQGGSSQKTISISTHKARADKINTVIPKIWDSAQDFKEVSLEAVKNTVAIAEDGQELTTEVSLPTVSTASQAAVVCNFMLKDSFDPLILKANFKLTAYAVELFDNISLTIPRYGWENKIFNVLGKRQDASGNIELTLKETSAEIYNPLVASDSSGYAENTNLINPWDIQPPTISAVTSGTSELLLQADGTVVSRVKVTFGPVTDQRILQGGFIEVRWNVAGSSDYHWVSTAGDSASVYLLGVQDGSNLIIQARTRNSLAVSDWSLLTSHTVVGKTAPPSNVSSITSALEDGNLIARWPAVADADIAGYEIRTLDSGWGTSGYAFKGFSQSTLLVPYGDVSTWYVRAYDSSGNYSLTSAFTNFTKLPVPTPTTASSNVVNEKLRLSWSKVTPQFSLLGYELRSENIGFGSSGYLYKGPAEAFDYIPPNGTQTFYVRAYDIYGSYSASSASTTFTPAAVPAPSPASSYESNNSLHLTYTNVSPAFGLGGYEIRTSDSGWGSSGEVYRGFNTTVEVDPPAGGTWYVRSFDKRGVYSATVSVVYTASSVPNVTGITHFFADTSLTAATVTLSWTDAAPGLGLSGYEITYGSTTVTSKANTLTVEANWVGDRLFTIKTVDSYGTKSNGSVYNISKFSPNPAQNFRAQVIDNNVLFYWSLPAKTSLPIAHSKLYVGDTFATADVIGIKAGEFTVVSELAGGYYSYWVTIVDTDNNESAPVKVTTYVAQPPDFVFYAEKPSTFSGTKSNATVDMGDLLLPVNLTESFSQHFSTPGWASPQAQVSAGYPVFIQPGLASGYYEETFDIGTVVASSSVNVILDSANVAGNPAIGHTLSVSLDGSTWTTYSGLTRVFAINFRYVKYRITATQNSSGDMYIVRALTVRLDNKLKTDSGRVDALLTDTDGTIVNFNSEFVDVISINPSVKSTDSRTACYAFKDAVLNGTYSVTGGIATVNVTGHELKAGQKVRLMPSSGLLPIGVYTVASVLSANSFTSNIYEVVSVPNTSGNLAIYPNSFRVYVFDASGNRQSNEVSWTIRGS